MRMLFLIADFAVFALGALYVSVSGAIELLSLNGMMKPGTHTDPVEAALTLAIAGSSLIACLLIRLYSR